MFRSPYHWFRSLALGILLPVALAREPFPT